MEEQEKKRVKLKKTPAETVAALKELVKPRDGMSDVTREGFGLLSKLDDRSLFELFIQLHVKQIDREKVMERLVGQLKEHLTEAGVDPLIVAFQRFVETSGVLIEEDAPEKVDDWEDTKTVDEMREFNGLFRSYKKYFFKVLREAESMPAIVKGQELDRATNTMSKLIKDLSVLAINTGNRKAPEETVQHKLDGAFQELIKDMSENSRGSMAKAAARLIQRAKEYKKTANE